MASLAKRLAEIEKAATGGKLHLQLLKAWAEHGQKASCTEAVDFLARLRKTLSGTADRRVTAQWADDCTKHQGWQLLQSRLLRQSRDGLPSLSNGELSRAYNTLRHVGRNIKLEQEIGKVWPLVLSRVESGSMRDTRSLIGVWTVAPDEQLPVLDAALARTLGDAERVAVPQLLVGISRASACPGSAAVKWCAGELSRRSAELSVEDLVAVIAHLDALQRHGGAADDELAQVVSRAMGELVSRPGDMQMEPQHLVRLFPSIHSRTDPLYKKVRQQLLAKLEMMPTHIFEVMRLIHRLSDGSTPEQQLYNIAASQLRNHFAKDAQPPLVLLAARNLDLLVHDNKTCLDLLNCAARLRKDLYPTALWRIFVRASDVNLVGRHPILRNRVRSLANTIEQHGIGGQRMTLTEMRSIAEAMRRNDVVLEKCIPQMSRRFLEVLEAVRKLPREGVEVEGAEASGGEVWGDITEAEEGSGKDWLAEVQRLLLGFWAQLRALGVEAAPELTEAVGELAAGSGAAAVDAESLASVLGDLRSLEDAQVAELCTDIEAQLISKLPSVSQQILLRIADAAGYDAIRAAVTDEVGRRLGASRSSSSGAVASVASLRRVEDFDSVVSFLVHHSAWSRDMAESSEGHVSEGDAALIARAEELVAISVSSIMEKEPAKACQRLSGALRALLAHGPRLDTPVGSLANALHLLARLEASGSVERAPLPLAADLAFAYCVLFKGSPPFDVAARLCRLLGGAALRGLPRSAAAGSAAASPEAVVAVAAESDRAAELWAIGHSIRSSASPSARAALRLMPEAAALDACLARFEEKPGQVSFSLFRDVNSELCLSRLRQHLPAESFAGELLQEPGPAAAPAV